MVASSASGKVSVTVLDVSANGVASSSSGKNSVTVLVNSTPSSIAVAVYRRVSSIGSETSKDTVTLSASGRVSVTV